MKIEFDFKVAGLVEARTLKVQQFFVNGGLMSRPNVYMVTRAYPDPYKPRRDMEEETIQVFNMTRGELQRFRADSFVAVVDVILKIGGYSDPRAETSILKVDKHREFVDPVEVSSYTVQWLVELNAETPQHAAQRAQAILRDPHDDRPQVFNVTDELGRVTAVDLRQPSPKEKEREQRQGREEG